MKRSNNIPCCRLICINGQYAALPDWGYTFIINIKKIDSFVKQVGFYIQNFTDIQFYILAVKTDVDLQAKKQKSKTAAKYVNFMQD